MRDVVSGTKKVNLSNVEVSKYIGRYGALSMHYYVSGIDEEGNRIRLEISGEDYSQLSHKDEIVIEYYEHTDRVVDYQ